MSQLHEAFVTCLVAQSTRILRIEDVYLSAMGMRRAPSVSACRLVRIACRKTPLYEYSLSFCCFILDGFYRPLSVPSEDAKILRRHELCEYHIRPRL